LIFHTFSNDLQVLSKIWFLLHIIKDTDHFQIHLRIYASCIHKNAFANFSLDIWFNCKWPKCYLSHHFLFYLDFWFNFKICSLGIQNSLLYFFPNSACMKCTWLPLHNLSKLLAHMPKVDKLYNSSLQRCLHLFIPAKHFASSIFFINLW
jgi:hypothetical protein